MSESSDDKFVTPQRPRKVAPPRIQRNGSLLGNDRLYLETLETPSLAKYTQEQLTLAQEIQDVKEQREETLEELTRIANDIACRREQYLDRIVDGTEPYDAAKIQAYLVMEQEYRAKMKELEG